MARVFTETGPSRIDRINRTSEYKGRRVGRYRVGRHRRYVTVLLADGQAAGGVFFTDGGGTQRS